jgi:heterodisulfide reductase subunit A-like polyferredoxin
MSVARDYKFMCSDPGQEMIEKDIKVLAQPGGGGLLFAPAA